jgi:hypothetical protein
MISGVDLPPDYPMISGLPAAATTRAIRAMTQKLPTHTLTVNN